MKKISLLLSFVFLLFFTHAQPFQIMDLKQSVGHWEGSLTYLDYSTGKPYTMSANISISLTNDQKGYIMGFEYPKEPHANAADTSYVANGIFGQEKIVSFKKEPSGDFALITEKFGEDGNDHQKATLRHNYHLKGNAFSISKEVKFDGTDKWIKRNAYQFIKKVDGAQQDENAVKATIQQLFDGMRNADSISIASVFAPNAIMQTIVVDKDGNTAVSQSKVANFVSYVGKQAKGAADEQITFETIKIDGALAIVWTPYRFVYNGQFSHCGVNSFTLVKLPDGWKINYLIDTRRKTGCD